MSEPLAASGSISGGGRPPSTTVAPASHPDDMPAKELSFGSRITVVELVNWQPHRGSPDVSDVRWDQLIATDEQMYHRELKVEETWQRVDFSWLTGKVSMLLLEHVEGDGSLLLCCCVAGHEPERSEEADWVVGRTECFRGTPMIGKQLWLRSASGLILCDLKAYPN